MPAFFAAANRKGIILKATEQIIGLVYFCKALFKEVTHQIFHPSARIDIPIGHKGKQSSSGRAPIRSLEGKGKELQAPGKRDAVAGKGMMQIDENSQPQEPDILPDLSRSKGKPLCISGARYHPICPKMVDIEAITKKG